jgi:hypothetical protein
VPIPPWGAILTFLHRVTCLEATLGNCLPCATSTLARGGSESVQESAPLPRPSWGHRSEGVMRCCSGFPLLHLSRTCFVSRAAVLGAERDQY